MWIYMILGTVFVFIGYKYDEKGLKAFQKFSYQKEMDAYNSYKQALKDYEWWQNHKKEEYWRSMDGYTFEKEVARIFSNRGYKTQLTKKGADGGIDIELNKNGQRIAVQCKAHKKKISEGVVRDLYGVLHSYNYDKGILVTLNGGSSNTVAFCKNENDKPIEIMDVNDIIRLQES